MFKLLDFISSSSSSKSKATAKKEAEKETESDAEQPTFSAQEKAEIRRTMRQLNRETSMILTNKLTHLNLKALAEEFDAPSEDGEEEEYSTDTFCVKSLPKTTKSDTRAEEEEDNDNYGTFCVRSTGSSEQYGTFNVTNTNGPTRRDDPKVSQSAPDFSQMFREPESWEKHILALEKGEWTQGMEQNGAFKRWKKERPAMPSIYIREAARQDSK